MESNTIHPEGATIHVPNLWQRMNLIMKDVAYVQKEDKKVNNQYRYVSHDAVAAKVRPSMVEHGVVMKQEIISQTIEHQTYMKNGEEKNQICMTITMRYTFINIDEPEEHMEVDAVGIGIDPGDKASGKAMSYAKKYCLLQALLLETGDDPERDASSQVAPVRENTLKIRFQAAEHKALKRMTKEVWTDGVNNIKANESDFMKSIILIEEFAEAQ